MTRYSPRTTLRKTSPQFVGAEVGQEAELAEVDAEHRRLAIAHLPGGPEDGPVAAEHQGQVGRQRLRSFS